MERIADYDYHLPEDRIAQTPLEDRSASKLLWLNRQTGEIRHQMFRDVLDILNPGDLLVMNDTRVTAMRVFGRKATGASVEFLLLKDMGEGKFEALARPGKRLQPGTLVDLEADLQLMVEENLGEGRKLVRLPDRSLRQKLEEIALAPLPPYVHVPLNDRERYQTVYSDREHGGSAAAPTAGLHFTPELLRELKEKGVQTARVNLEVGLDTFRPISADTVADHTIHGERCTLPEETAEAITRAKGRIIGVGTTAVRTLESFATGPRTVEPGTKVTDIFIKPGYSFQVIDGMFTNFHMPRTTMLLMISALAGRENVLKAYEEALEGGYRFLSFGDSMVIL